MTISRMLIVLMMIIPCIITIQSVHARHSHHNKDPLTSKARSTAWIESERESYDTTRFRPFNDHDRKPDRGDDQDDNDLDDDNDHILPLGDRPSMCRQYDCPSFNATSYPTYTVRSYPNVTVACSNIRSFKYGDDEQKKAFLRLYDYFGGESDSGIKINMTVPVVRYVKPGNGSHPNVTVCFFLPDALRSNPPKPKNTDVHVFNTSFTVAVTPFPGYGTHSNVYKNLIHHQFALNLAGQDFVKDRYVHASYTEPWIPIFRYNEIWTFLANQTHAQFDQSDAGIHELRLHQIHHRRSFDTHPHPIMDTM